MCVIAVIPAGCEITKKQFDNAWLSNPDGFGFAFGNGERLTVRRGFFNEVVGWTTFRKELAANPDSAFILHWRIATSGCIDKKRAHPFQVCSQTAVAHNGIMGWLEPVDKKDKRSDTQVLVEVILQSLPKGWQRSSGVTLLLEEYIGANNKLAVATADGEAFILNEDAGVWNDGVWWSNKSALQSAKPSSLWYESKYWEPMGLSEEEQKARYCECCNYRLEGDEPITTPLGEMCTICAEEFGYSDDYS